MKTKQCILILFSFFFQFISATEVVSYLDMSDRYLEILKNKSDIQFYPNPSAAYLIIELMEDFNQSNTNISIYNLQRKLLSLQNFNQIIEGNKVQFNVSKLSSILYILSIKKSSRNTQLYFIKTN